VSDEQLLGGGDYSSTRTSAIEVLGVMKEGIEVLQAEQRKLGKRVSFLQWCGVN
jgi:hypothetical protein